MTTTESNGTVAVNGDTDEADDDAGTLDVFPPARPVEMAAIGTLREHVSAMRDAVFFAEGMCYTEMVPARFRGKPKDAAAAILFGAEVGLSPVAALRSVIVIHGMPGFEARTMKAILKAKGYGFRTIEKTATRAEIWAWEPDSPRIYDDEGQRINPDDRAVWTIDDAVQAGFVPKLLPNGKWENNSNGKLKGNMKYIETPKVMLDAKVTAEVCRSIAPHILLGLPYASEELSEIADDITDTIADEREPDQTRGTAALRTRAQKARKKKRDDESVQEPQDAEEVPVPEPTTDAPDQPAPADAPEPTPAVPDQPPAETSPAPPEADPTPASEDPPKSGGPTVPVGDPEATAGVDHPPATAEAASAVGPPTQPEDVPMSDAVRSKGVDMATGLLINGGITDISDRADAVTEIVAKWAPSYRRIESVEALTNGELKYVVDTLREWKGKGKLADYLVEAINHAGLREAGLLENPYAGDEAQG